MNNLKSNEGFLREYVELCSKEWGTACDEIQFKIKVNKKLNKLLSDENDKLISALGLIDDSCLIGFISLLRTDGEKRADLTP